MAPTHNLQEVMVHENAEAVHACVKTLCALGRLTDKEKGAVRNWTRPNLSQLALINPTGRAEWALHVVVTASLVFDHFEKDVLSQLPVHAAAERIRSALLADLRHILPATLAACEVTRAFQAASFSKANRSQALLPPVSIFFLTFSEITEREGSGTYNGRFFDGTSSVVGTWTALK